MTKMTASSDEIQSPAASILANPGEKHITAWEQMLQAMDEQSTSAPLDCLGRTPAERKRYKPSVDDLLGPEPDEGPPWETLEDIQNKDYRQWCDDMGIKSLEENVPAKTTTETKPAVLVFKDHKLEFPELHMKIALLGPPEDTRGFPELFARAYCEGASDLHDADLVVFTGGPDVDPAYYGEKAIENYYGNEERDFEDLAAYMTCIEEGIPMLGVCRGAQFLAAMNQFKLVQDTDNHQSDHPMWDVRQKMMIEKVSSRHHQSVIPGPGMDVLGTSHASTLKVLNPDTTLSKTIMGTDYPVDIEAYFIRKTCCIGVQGHPEYKHYNAFAKWTLDLLHEYIILNEDVIWSPEGKRRLSPEIIKEEQLIQTVSKEKA